MSIKKFRVKECGNSAEHAFYRAIEVALADDLEYADFIAGKKWNDVIVIKTDTSCSVRRENSSKIKCIPLGDGEYLFSGRIT